MLPPTLVGPRESFKPRESFSPSQLAAFAGEGGCKRKWALRSLWGVSELKKSIATVLGTLIHACLEHYIKGRTVNDLVASDGTLRISERDLQEVSTVGPEKLKELVAIAPQRALAGLHYLPNINDPAVEKKETERWIEVDTTRIMGGVEPIKINGKIDLSIRRVGIWYLYDHKSTKGKAAQKGLPADPWAYVKTPEQLRKDPQAAFYAADIMLRHDLDSLWCRWVYYLTDPKAHPLAKAVDVELTRAEVLKSAYEWLLVAVEMRELVRAAIAGTLSLDDIAPAALLPPHPLSPCSAYGGCPYSIAKGGPCSPEGEVKLGSLLLTATPTTPKKDDDNMSLQDAYNATQAALGIAPTGPMVPPGNPLVPPEAPVALPPGFEMGPAGMRAIAPAGWQYNAAGGLELVPPPAPTPPPPPVATAPLAPPPIPDPPAEGKGKRGRPAGAKNKVEDVIDLIFTSNDDALATLTVAQIKAIKNLVEAA
jgi:hypothetical protein